MKHNAFIIMLTVLMSMVTSMASAYDFVSGGIYYNKLTTSTVSVTYKSYGTATYTGAVTIPESFTYSGTKYYVVEIGENAFWNCAGLTSISIPGRVMKIGNRAFYGCTSLATLTLNEGLQEIGDYAFSSCSKLTSLTIPNGVRKIGEYAFAGCRGLTTVSLFPLKSSNTTNLVSIGKDAFQTCSKISRVEYGSLERLCKTHFNTAYSNPMAATTVSVNLYINGSRVTQITIPSGITQIYPYAFCNGPELISVTIPEGVKAIGKQAFYKCRNLGNVSIPSSMVHIGELALHQTKWYTNQPEGMVYAGKVAYKYKGTLPENASIELKEGTIGIADEIFADSTKLASITLPGSVTRIGNSSFKGCTGLSTFTLPASVNYIDSYAFQDCTLYTVSAQNPEPGTLLSDAFNNASDIILYVPSGSKDAYEAADYWNEFKKILEMSPVGDINGDGKVTIADVTKLVNIILGKD